jgi:hypothetical protein
LERNLHQGDIPAVVRYLPPDQGRRSDTFTVIIPARSGDALEGGGTIEIRGDGGMRFEIDKALSSALPHRSSASNATNGNRPGKG